MSPPEAGIGKNKISMNTFTALISNSMLWSAVTAWFIAQITKFIINIIRQHQVKLSLMVSSGGMPSSHSSAVCALTSACAKSFGIGSGLFAVCCVFSIIVMYDASGVRRAAGEQAKILNKITADLQKGDTKYIGSDLKELIGHTPLQVIIGAMLGIAVGLLYPTMNVS